MSKPLDENQIKEHLGIETAYYTMEESARSFVKVGQALGISKDKVRHSLGRISQWRLDHPSDTRLNNKDLLEGESSPTEAVVFELPKKGEVARYVLTSAQNNTKVLSGFLDNLETYCSVREAQLLIGTFTYSQNLQNRFLVKRGTGSKQEGLWWDKRVVPYIHDERVQLAEGLYWCGDWNILPTATDPVSGIDSFNGTSSNVFPHTKLRQKAIATDKSLPAKYNMTTGTVTKINMAKRKAGLKAEFDQVFSALVVEVDSDGQWFHRQLVADSDTGDFYDLGSHYCGGKVLENVGGVAGIIHGDIHAAQLNKDVHSVGLEATGDLKPKHSVLHDVLDFYSRNHHSKNKVGEMFEKFCEGRDSVEEEIRETSGIVKSFTTNSPVYIAYSNHDDQIKRWLDSLQTDYRFDHVNAIYYLKMMHRFLTSIRDKESEFNIFEYALRDGGLDNLANKITFAHNEDDSFIIAGIETGKHGHIGASGSRGSLNQYANLGQKIVVGHYHKSEINRGAWSVGVYGNLDMGYNKGPSAWSHSFCIIYPNGKRCLCEIKKTSDGYKYKL